MSTYVRNPQGDRKKVTTAIALEAWDSSKDFNEWLNAKVNKNWSLIYSSGSKYYRVTRGTLPLGNKYVRIQRVRTYFNGDVTLKDTDGFDLYNHYVIVTDGSIAFFNEGEDTPTKVVKPPGKGGVRRNLIYCYENLLN